jgi:hypothetical protein
MLGSVVPLQLLRQSPRLLRWEGGVERGWREGVQVVDHQSETLDLRELLIKEPADHLGE